MGETGSNVSETSEGAEFDEPINTVTFEERPYVRPSEGFTDAVHWSPVRVYNRDTVEELSSSGI